MSIQEEAQIYLASQRGHFQQAGFRSLRTLNFEDYEAVGRESVGNLLAFNDETLLAQESYLLESREVCRVILVPMVGGIEVSDRAGEPVFVNSGEVLAVNVGPDITWQVSNPYAEEAINYLQIRLKGGASDNSLLVSHEFDLSQKNALHSIYQDKSGTNIVIGKYEGRAEDIVNTGNQAAFSFIIEGAFEVQNRLLEKRDALSVHGAEEVDFEALSNEAVILIVRRVNP